MKGHPDGDHVELEKALHGTPMFPCICYDSWIVETFPAFSLHWHPEVEFNLVIQGQAEGILDFQPFTAREGDVILVNKKVAHGFFRKDDWNFNCKAVVFRLDFLADKTGDDIFEDYIAPLERGEQAFAAFIRPDHPIYPRLRSLLEETFSLYEEMPPCYKLLIKAKLTEALYLLYAGGCVQATLSVSTRSRSLKKTVDYIGKNYARPISAQEAADVAGYSKYHFLRIFKEAVGMDYTRYVNQIRLDHAAALLRQTNLSVTEIALTVGFSDSAYFTKRFKEAYHTTPVAFRREGRGG